ncbi:MAG: flippase [Desulfobacteraceae bacterium]|nr:flippase [Desulfobacteraceae bacterium]
MISKANKLFRIFTGSRGSILSPSIVFFGLRVCGIGLAYALSITVSRFYGPHIFGVFMLCWSILQVTTVFGRLGFDVSILRFVADEIAMGPCGSVRSVYFNIIGLTLVITFCIALMFRFTSPFIASHVFHKPDLANYFSMVLYSLPFYVILSISAAFLRAFKDITMFSFLQNVSIYLLTLAGIFVSMPYVNQSPMLPFRCFIFASVISAFAGLLLSVRKLVSTESDPDRQMNLSSMVRISFPMFLTSSMFLVLSWNDTFMLGAMRSEAEVGIYNAALRVASVISLPLISVNSIIGPKIAELYANKHIEDLRHLIYFSSKLMFVSAGSIFAIVVFFAPFWLSLFGPSFKTGVFTLIFLSVGYLLNALCGSVGYILNMTGRQNIFSRIIVSASIFNIILNYAGIRFYGIEGAAAATTLCSVYWNLASVYVIKRELDINIFSVYSRDKGAKVK